MISLPQNRLVIGGATAVAIAIGGVGFATLDKVVTIDRGGQMMTAHTFRGTVAEVLASQGITVGEHDVVTPPLNSTLSEGQTITVDHARQVTVAVDGAKKATDWTTEDTVGDALAAMKIGVPAGAEVVPAPGTEIKTNMSIAVTTPKPVKLKVAGKSRDVKSTAATVADLLKDQKVTVGAKDKVKPAVTVPVTKGMSVTVDRVTTKTVTKTKAVKYSTKKLKDTSKYTDETKVVKPGKKGSSKVTVVKTYVNGKLKNTKTIKTVVTKKPTAAVVKVGTKKRPGNTGSVKGLNLARAAMWDRIAQCESGGRWNINTGNGYYGGLQFNAGTWLASGGGKYAQRADLATRAQQITIANRLYAQRGLGPWGCAHAAG